ncbi:unnamed protein product, partial [Mesorhabditis spiculigera]
MDFDGVIDISSYPTIAFWVRIFSAFAFVLNIIGLAAVAYGNPAVLAHYRRYLIIYQIYSTITDAILGGLAFPILAFPNTGGYSIGLFTDCGVPTQMQLVIGLMLISGLFGAKIVIFLERQQAALHQTHYFRLSRSFHKFTTYFMYLAPFGNATFVCIVCYYNNVSQAVVDSLQKYPALRQFILNPAYLGFQRGYDLLITLYLFFVVAGAGVIIAATTLPSFHAFKTQQLILSERTLQMQKRWLGNLCIQTMLLCAMVLTPIFYGVVVYLTQRIYLAAFTIWGTVLFSQQGTAMTVLNFILFRSYRRAYQPRFPNSFRDDDANSTSTTEAHTGSNAAEAKNKPGHSVRQANRTQ